MRTKKRLLIAIMFVAIALVIGSISYLVFDKSDPKDTLMVVLDAAKSKDIDTFIANSYDKRIPNGSIDEKRKFYEDIFQDENTQIDSYKLINEQVVSKNKHKFLVQIITKDGTKSEVPITLIKRGFKWIAEFGEDIKG